MRACVCVCTSIILLSKVYWCDGSVHILLAGFPPWVCVCTWLPLFRMERQRHTITSTREPPEGPETPPAWRASSMSCTTEFKNNRWTSLSATTLLLPSTWSAAVSEGLPPSIPPSLSLSLSVGAGQPTPLMGSTTPKDPPLISHQKLRSHGLLPLAHNSKLWMWLRNRGRRWKVTEAGRTLTTRCYWFSFMIRSNENTKCYSSFMACNFMGLTDIV